MILQKMVLLATAFKQRTAAHAPTKVGHSSTTRCLYGHYKVLCTVTTTSLYTRVVSKMLVDKLLKPILFNNKARSRP